MNQAGPTKVLEIFCYHYNHKCESDKILDIWNGTLQNGLHFGTFSQDFCDVYHDILHSSGGMIFVNVTEN